MTTNDDVLEWLQGDDSAQPEPETDFVALVHRLLEELVRSRSTSLHLEPRENQVHVRFRRDGTLHELKRLPGTMARPLAARFKILASLDVAERRLPQEGEIQHSGVDLRVLTFPTGHGELVDVARVDEASLGVGLRDLGLGDQLETVDRKSTRLNS